MAAEATADATDATEDDEMAAQEHEMAAADAAEENQMAAAAAAEIEQQRNSRDVRAEKRTKRTASKCMTGPLSTSASIAQTSPPKPYHFSFQL